MCPHGQGRRGSSQCGHFADKGRGSIFGDFVRISFIDGPLRQIIKFFGFSSIITRLLRIAAHLIRCYLDVVHVIVSSKVTAQTEVWIYTVLKGCLVPEHHTARIYVVKKSIWRQTFDYVSRNAKFGLELIKLKIFTSSCYSQSNCILICEVSIVIYFY